MPSLGEDLSDLRKKKNLTLKNIFDETRIPIYILKAIEDSSIFKDPKQNVTYVRSFVRTYAKVIRIRESDILKALDQTYSGKYSGFIADKYNLKKSSDKSGEEKKDKDKDKDNDEDTNSTSSQEYHPNFSLDSPAELSPEGKGNNERNELYNPNTLKTNTGKSEYSHPDLSKPHNKRMSEPPSVHNVNWAEMGNKIGSFKKHTPITIIAVTVVIILIAASYFVYTRYESPDGSQTGKNLQNVLPVDTLSSKTESVTGDSTNTSNSNVAAIPPSLPDTLHIVVYAAYNKLNPVRIRSDLSNRLNPYWIDKGQAMRFRFLNNIYIRGQYKRMMLLFHGHPIPNIIQYRQNDGTLLIQRSMIENHKDWWKPSNGGPLPNGVPWPSAIHNTPIY